MVQRIHPAVEVVAYDLNMVVPENIRQQVAHLIVARLISTEHLKGTLGSGLLPLMVEEKPSPLPAPANTEA